MTALIIPRRALIGGLAGLIAAPAVVRAASLMPVRGLPAVAPVTPAFGFEAAAEGGWFGVPGWWDLGDAIARLAGAPAGAGRLIA